jgi:hypothetical protein
MIDPRAIHYPRHTVTNASNGYELFDAPAGYRLRMGHWHESPRADEITVGFVSVRQSDPDFPYFATPIRNDQ